jgi:hypothetical protein
LGPFQGTTPHNHISIVVKDAWHEGAYTLSKYIYAAPTFPDYASISDPASQEPDRFGELHQGYGPSDFVKLISRPRPIVAPFGPFGLIGDIYWFNYFGTDFVEFIGDRTLTSAGWARFERIGGGLACYTTEKIGDPSFGERRGLIAKSLEKYLWTPGCAPEGRLSPRFDFSEQLRGLSARTLASLDLSFVFGSLNLSGFSESEQCEVIEALKRVGLTYDPTTAQVLHEGRSI